MCIKEVLLKENLKEKIIRKLKHFWWRIKNLQSLKYRIARKIVVNTLEKDEEFAETYIANIACVLMDNVEILKDDHIKRNEVATKIFKWIFSK